MTNPQLNGVISLMPPHWHSFYSLPPGPISITGNVRVHGEITSNTLNPAVFDFLNTNDYGAHLDQILSNWRLQRLLGSVFNHLLTCPRRKGDQLLYFVFSLSVLSAKDHQDCAYC